MIRKLTHWAREDTKPASNGEDWVGTAAIFLVSIGYGGLVFGDGLMAPLALMGSSIFVVGIAKWIGWCERRRREASDIVRHSLKECYQIELARLEEDEQR